MATNRNSRYQLEKLSHRNTGYPMATVAYYGPDDKRASKVVVGLFRVEGQKEPEMKKWFSDTEDLRLSPTINQEIVDFLRDNHVGRVAMLDRIIGCPHEEGIDYPEGETCPQCPFWANRDRWTGKVLS